MSKYVVKFKNEPEIYGRECDDRGLSPYDSLQEALKDTALCVDEGTPPVEIFKLVKVKCKK